MFYWIHKHKQYNNYENKIYIKKKKEKNKETIYNYATKRLYNTVIRNLAEACT